jgi:hypothetical protein
MIVFFSHEIAPLSYLCRFQFWFLDFHEIVAPFHVTKLFLELYICLDRLRDFCIKILRAKNRVLFQNGRKGNYIFSRFR